MRSLALVLLLFLAAGCATLALTWRASLEIPPDASRPYIFDYPGCPCEMPWSGFDECCLYRRQEVRG